MKGFSPVLSVFVFESCEALLSARQQGRRSSADYVAAGRGNAAGATRSRRGTVVGEAAGSAWQRGLRGSGAGVATWPARHAAGEALWSARQQDRRGSADCMAAGPAWQHGRRDTRPARHCGRRGSRIGVAPKSGNRRSKRHHRLS
jgi:hypothetical protein